MAKHHKATPRLETTKIVSTMASFKLAMTLKPGLALQMLGPIMKSRLFGHATAGTLFVPTWVNNMSLWNRF